MTKAQQAALEWLIKHNGSGSFLKWPEHHVLLAAGERAPIMRSTWTALAKLGKVRIENGRVTVIANV